MLQGMLVRLRSGMMAGVVLKAGALALEYSPSTHNSSSGLKATPASTAAPTQTTPYSLTHTPPLQTAHPPVSKWLSPLSSLLAPR